MAKEFTDGNFEQEVLKSDIPVLVDFWAPWCGPCKMVGPVIEEIAGELEGQVSVGKVNVDDNQVYAGKYGVMSIPTIILIKNGEEVARVVGFKPKEELLQMIEDNK